MAFDSFAEMGYRFFANNGAEFRIWEVRKIDNSTASYENRRICFFKTLLVGLTVAHITATAVVYSSDTALLKTVESVTRAGYVSVPGLNVVPPLDSIRTAFFGGLFFTLSIGICLSFFGFAGAWLWRRALKSDRKSLALLAIFPAACVWKANGNGFCMGTTAFFVFVPVAAFVAGAFLSAPESEKKRSPIVFHVGAFLVPVVILAVVISTLKIKIDSEVFTRFRDDWLISNPVGLAVNDFYYTYTLYPAQVFKSLNQRTIRTCKFSENTEPVLAKRLERTLTNKSWLVMPGKTPVDLDISVETEFLEFAHMGKPILRTTHEEFFKNPVSTLEDFSTKTDRHAFFRQFTFFSILFSCSVTLYMFLFGVFRLIASLFSRPKRAVVIACALTILAETAFLVSLVYEKKYPADAKTAFVCLKSGDVDERIRALKTLYHLGINPGNFPDRARMLTSPYMPERYWTAKILRFGKGPEAYRDIVSLLNDAHLSVAYNALEALGDSGNRKGTEEILKRMQTYDNWYVQMYAYKTLRRLGWRQARSD